MGTINIFGDFPSKYVRGVLKIKNGGNSRQKTTARIGKDRVSEFSFNESRRVSEGRFLFGSRRVRTRLALF